MQKTKNQTQKEGLYKTVYKCDIYARYLEYQPKPRPIHIKCKTIHMLSEEGKQSLLEFLVGANYSNSNVDARNLSFKSDKNKSN